MDVHVARKRCFTPSPGAILILAILAAFAGCQGEPEGGPRIQFENTFDDRGNTRDMFTKVHSVFRFWNRGDAPLRILDVQTSCACIAPEYSKEEVAPGAEGKVSLIATIEGMPGVQRFDLMVESNDPKNRLVKLRATITLLPPLPEGQDGASRPAESNRTTTSPLLGAGR